jgi:glycosyltransferase involved in cell wall biosynthesis
MPDKAQCHYLHFVLDNSDAQTEAQLMAELKSDSGTQGLSEYIRDGRRNAGQGNLEEAIRCYAKGTRDPSPLGKICRQNLTLTTRRHRKQREELSRNPDFKLSVVVAASEMSHNAAGRATVLYQCYRRLGNSCTILGCHFPLWGRDLWPPLRSMNLPIESFVVERESRFAEDAMHLVLQHPADLVHLSKPRLPTVLLGALYKWLWGATVLMDIDDEELCFVGEREPINLEAFLAKCDGSPEARDLMGSLWTRLAVNLGQKFDGITVANRPLQLRYGGTVIPHARDPEQLKPATDFEKAEARRRFGVAEIANVVLFFGTPRRHKGLLTVAAAIAALPEALRPCFVLAGEIPNAERKTGLKDELRDLLPPDRLLLLGHQPFEQASQVLALADLVVLLGEGEVAEFQSPAKLSDALAMGLPVLVSDAAPMHDVVERGWAVQAAPEHLVEQLQEWLSNRERRAQQGQAARAGFLEELALPDVAARLAVCAREAFGVQMPLDSNLANLLRDLGFSL